jgi:hypothetical protein
MNDFIDIIQDRLEGKKRHHRPDEFSFNQKIKRLQPELHSIAKELQKLVEVKATLDNGSLFQYSIDKNGEPPYYIVLGFSSAFSSISYGNEFDKTNKSYSLYESHRSTNFRNSFETQSEKEFLKFLAKYLGDKLGDLGLLDKQIYNKKTQDHLGI